MPRRTIRGTAHLLNVGAVGVRLAQFVGYLTSHIFDGFIGRRSTVTHVVAPGRFPRIPYGNFPFTIGINYRVSIINFFDRLFRFESSLLFAERRFVIHLPVIPQIGPRAISRDTAFVLFELFDHLNKNEINALFND